MSRVGEKIIIRGLTKVLLIALGTGAVIGVALAFPAAGVLFREFEKAKWNGAKKRGSLKATIRRLERQKLVSWQDRGGELQLALTENGEKKVMQYNIDELSIKKPKKWDNLWRIIIFDIPEKKKIAREMFRKKLKEMEFYQLQKSVFVYPYECRDEIEFLKYNLEIAAYVQFILAKEIEGIEMKMDRYK